MFKRNSARAAGMAITILVATAAHPAWAESYTVVTAPPGLLVVVDGTNTLAPATFLWDAGSPHTLDTPSPQLNAEGQTRFTFSGWTGGGPESQTILAPAEDTTNTASFATQYLLEINVAPAGSGTVSNNPAGPWYDSGQSVSLMAITNAGYRFSTWQGTDTSISNGATVAMDSYRLVQANFVPADFPYLVVTNPGAVAPGNLIGNVDGRTADGTKLYYVILDNSGSQLVFGSKTNTLYRFVTPQGFDAVSGAGGFNFKDETLKVVGTASTLGYTLDSHDLKLLPNGHALIFGTEVRTVDMSALAPGGKTAASVTGDIVQEIDGNRLVFEWHTFDHIAISNSFYDLTQQTIDYAHMNAVSLDPTDNNLLVSLRTTSEIVKINRQTGAVMWRLGGKQNQFAFIGEHPENAPYYTVGQHDIHRLANGHLLFFDNGNISGGGVTPSDRTYSRAVEYQLDEINKTATLVWEFRHSPDISVPCTGSVERFANGNTLIGWGCAIPTSGTIATEVNAAGQVVFELKHRNPPGSSSLLLGNGVTKEFWNSPELVRLNGFVPVEAGQIYDATNAGVSVTFTNLTGPAENALLVERRLDAVRFPSFDGKAPQVLMEHVILSASNLSSFTASVVLRLPDTSFVFDTPVIHDPSQVVVYHRSTPGRGQFSPLPTSYDEGLQSVSVTASQTGEFIFTYPDLNETPFEPTILSPADQTQVNQSAPLALIWVPEGLVGSFDVQVSTNADFSSLVVDTNGLGSARFTVASLLPTTAYFWRVRTVNEGGASDWASASFTTVPPFIHVIYPAGGETWQRFQAVTIRWEDNLSENVAIDMYKGGVSNRNFVASTPSSGSFSWTVGQFQAFPVGSDYTLKIRSVSETNIYVFSQPFSLITNLSSVTIDTRSLSNSTDGNFQFGFSIPGALQASVLASTNLTDWGLLQVVPLTNGSAVFTDTTATNYGARFYRLRVP